MTTTVVHTNARGVYFTYVKDDGPNFGYSARVAYAMGLDKPRYPVPAIRYAGAIAWHPCLIEGAICRLCTSVDTCCMRPLQ